MKAFAAHGGGEPSIVRGLAVFLVAWGMLTPRPTFRSRAHAEKRLGSLTRGSAWYRRAVSYPRTRAYVKALAARWPTRASEIEDDVAEYRGLTPEENDAVVSGLARSAIEILRGRPDFAEAMAEQELPAPDYDTIMARLRRKRAG